MVSSGRAGDTVRPICVRLCSCCGHGCCIFLFKVSRGIFGVISSLSCILLELLEFESNDVTMGKGSSSDSGFRRISAFL